MSKSVSCIACLLSWSHGTALSQPVVVKPVSEVCLYHGALAEHACPESATQSLAPTHLVTCWRILLVPVLSAQDYKYQVILLGVLRTTNTII